MPIRDLSEPQLLKLIYQPKRSEVNHRHEVLVTAPNRLRMTYINHAVDFDLHADLQKSADTRPAVWRARRPSILYHGIIRGTGTVARIFGGHHGGGHGPE